MKEVTLPSGTVLKIQLATFAEAMVLNQAMLEEVRGLKIDATTEIDVNLYKDLFCVGLSSKKIESALWTCMKSCLYGDFRISKDTFEPEAARDDYFTVCFEVAKENIRPFAKSLYAQYGHILASLKKGPA